MPIHPNRQRAQRWPLSRSLFWPLSFLLLFFMPAPLLAQSAPSETYTLPFDWQGEASVAARDLGNTAPPFEAQVGAGTFQLSYVPVETGAVLRVQPSPDTSAGQIALLWPMTATGEPPAPTGQVVTFTLTARLYAPDAQAYATLRDDTGSSSVPIDSLTWSDYSVTRQIDDAATGVQIGLTWDNVPATAWLEVRDMTVHFAPPAAEMDLSPTDTPTPVGAAALPTPQPPTPTPTPTPFAIATPTPLATPTPALIIVTSTPTPVDVFEEATRMAQATEWSRFLGPATATPEQLATPTPTLTPIVVTNTPTPENAATATMQVLYATAVAFTTGTPTPIPPEAVVLVATDTPPPTPRPTNTPRPTATATPYYVLLDSIPTPTATVEFSYPEELYNKIVFLTDYRGNRNRPNPMIMNPDGTGVGLLSGEILYSEAARRDAYSPDGRFHVYALHEAGGAAHNAGRIQIFYDDYFYDSFQHQLTYFGSGTAWSPAWSPAREVIALVSSDTGNDEIWLVEPNTWPPKQLTQNEWEWDHHPSFSPDGNQIVFSSNRVSGRRQIWMMDINGENQRQITDFPFEAWDPVWVKYVGPAPATP